MRGNDKGGNSFCHFLVAYVCLLYDMSMDSLDLPVFPRALLGLEGPDSVHLGIPTWDLAPQASEAPA